MARVLQCLICFIATSSVLSRNTHPTDLLNQGAVHDSIPQVTSLCRKTGVCSYRDVLNYPIEFAKEIISKVPVRIENSTDVDEQISHRLGEDTTIFEIPICAAKRMIFFPFALPDEHDEYHFVANTKEKKVQGFFVELCERDTTTQKPLGCSPLIHFQDGYEGTGCTQKFVYKVVVVIKGGKSLVEKKLKVPSCCTCSITRTYTSPDHDIM